MDKTMENKKALSDDELWDKAGTDQPITIEDLGISRPQTQDGLQSLIEGFSSRHNVFEI